MDKHMMAARNTRKPKAKRFNEPDNIFEFGICRRNEELSQKPSIFHAQFSRVGCSGRDILPLTPVAVFHDEIQKLQNRLQRGRDVGQGGGGENVVDRPHIVLIDNPFADEQRFGS